MPEKKKEQRPRGAVQAPRPPKAGAAVPKAGRTTPKGGREATSGRYTPPIPPEYKTSPRWVPIAMAILLVGGMLTIITNYLGVLSDDGASNTYLLGGLGLITLGFIVATRWR